MAKRIIWAPQAVADRIQILDYWYKRLGTKDYSVNLDEMFKETVQLLSRFPQLGRQLENREERVFVKDHYQIFYLDEEGDHQDFASMGQSSKSGRSESLKTEGLSELISASTRTGLAIPLFAWNA